MTEGRGNEAGDNVERSGLEPKESLKGESISSTEQNTDHKKVIEDQRSRPESFKSFSDGMPAINPLVLEDSLTGDVFYDAGKRNSAVQADDGSSETAGGTDVYTGVGESTDAVSLAESGVGSPDAATDSGNSTVDAILAAAQNQAPPEAGMMQFGGRWYRQDQLVAANVESGFPGQEMRTATDATAALSPAEVQRQGGLKSLQDLQRLLPPGTSVRIQYHPDQRDTFDYLFSNNCPPEKWKPIVAAINAEINSETLPNNAPLFTALRDYAVKSRGKYLPADLTARTNEDATKADSPAANSIENMTPEEKALAFDTALTRVRNLIPPGGSVAVADGECNLKGFSHAQKTAFAKEFSQIDYVADALRDFARSNPGEVLRSSYLQPQLDTTQESPPSSSPEKDSHSESHWKPGDVLVSDVSQTELRPSTEQHRFADGVQQGDNVQDYLFGSGDVMWNGQAVRVELGPNAKDPVSANSRDGIHIGVSLPPIDKPPPWWAKEMHGSLSTGETGQRYFVVRSVLTVGGDTYALPYPTKIPLNATRAGSGIRTYGNSY